MATKVAPFLYLMDHQVNSKVKYQFFDMIGLPVGFEGKNPIFHLVSSTGAVEGWKDTTLNASAGTVVVDIEKFTSLGDYRTLKVTAEGRDHFAE